MTCGHSAPADEFYCPNSIVPLSAFNQGHTAYGQTTGSTNTVSFEVANLDTLLNTQNGTYYAFDDAGGTAATSHGTNSLNNDFDFGLPFFFGRQVYTGIEGYAAAGLSNLTGPYFAY
jgi:hypothetical protein